MERKNKNSQKKVNNRTLFHVRTPPVLCLSMRRNIMEKCSKLRRVCLCFFKSLEKSEGTQYNDMKENDVLCLMAKGEDKYQQVKGKLEDYVSDIGMAKRLTE